MKVEPAALTVWFAAALIACAAPSGVIHAGGTDRVESSGIDRSALADALLNRQLDRASTLIEGHSLGGVVFEDGRSPLDLLVSKPIVEPGAPGPAAASDESVRLLEKMLRAGADPNATDSTGMSPLMALAAFGEDTPTGAKMVETLVQNGADVNYQARGGRTALMLTAFLGRNALTDALLTQGADPSIENPEGNTAAGIARERGHLALAEKLSAR